MILGLKWSSIDFERKSITINHKVTEQLVNGKYVPVVSDVMKNKTSCRTLPPPCSHPHHLAAKKAPA